MVHSICPKDLTILLQLIKLWEMEKEGALPQGVREDSLGMPLLV